MKVGDIGGLAFIGSLVIAVLAFVFSYLFGASWETIALVSTGGIVFGTPVLFFAMVVALMIKRKGL